jgi:hypothetical protein
VQDVLLSNEAPDHKNRSRQQAGSLPAERGFGVPRRIHNLSDRQRRLVRPKIDRSEVSC